MKRFALNCLASGLAGGLLSHLVSSVRSRAEHGRGGLPMHAVSHIAWNDDPKSHRGVHAHNWAIGTALHHGASVFWAAFFEAFYGRDAERSTASALVGGATVAAAAYVTDYHLVSDRFKPGFEAHLSNRSLVAIYAALAIGLAAGARLRGLYRHQIKNRDERHERRNAQRSPRTVVAPE
ncbi:MAG TPA: hypothetical protein VED01_27275 [Burkholderiales bacterium]|nr:hypothetical protein [Burkholderiales bacterium]